MVLKIVSKFCFAVLFLLISLITGCDNAKKTDITKQVLFMRHVSIIVVKSMLKHNNDLTYDYAHDLKKHNLTNNLIINPNYLYWDEFFFQDNKEYKDYINMYCLFPTPYPKYKYLAITFGGVQRFFKKTPSFDKKYPNYPFGD